MAPGSPERPTPAWAWVGLGLILLLDLWLRGHTLGPSMRRTIGFAPYFTTIGETEPLDCDEALYAVMGRSMGRGEILYRDMTENKPPLGYWIYALGVSIGGANETAIRLLPIPMVLLTISLVWFIGLRLGGPLAAVAAAFAYAIASTDPYLYANGAHLEHAINLFSTAALACLISLKGRKGCVLAGLLIGAASLVRQVAVISLPLAIVFLWLESADRKRSGSGKIIALLAGFAAIWTLAAGILVAQGAGREAFDDIVRYGGALATRTPPEPNAPSFPIRWIVGNSDPRSGALPFPFGRTDWLVWWGSGTWPLFLMAIPALTWLAISSRTSPVDRRLVVAWTLSIAIQIALPGLFWAHYYLLAMPGFSIAVGIAIGDVWQSRQRWPGRIALLILATSILLTASILVRSYLLVPAERLAPLYKGGGQWLMLRRLGREIAIKTRDWDHPRLLLWGWQSPLYLYGNLDFATRQTFADPLMKALAAKGNDPLIRPRLDRMLGDIEARPPEFVMAGDPPFPRLLEFLKKRYLRTRDFDRIPDGRGLWVRKDRFDEFESRR